MMDGSKTVLIALGVALLVIVLVPALYMGICMATGMTGGMMNGMMGNMNGAGPWIMAGFAAVIVALGVGLLLAGLRRRI